ncbi:O-antigen ligase family protein [Mangrovitalea sediminis]|uniref:O-antigen ligase family protein n=1 Tax=Mangrovitalea sediminis TaxID=1982043 RepID=UPI00130417AA|nr:Wzy polymerase domain-containing protein [Mangrovitalea sediminis]
MKKTVYIILALYFFLPSLAVIRPWPLTSMVPDGGALVLFLVLGAWCLALLKLGRFVYSKSVFIYLSVAASSCISIYFSDYAYSAVWKWYVIVLFSCAIFVLGLSQFLSLVGVEGYLRVLNKILALSGFIYAVFGLFQYYGIDNILGISGHVATDIRLQGILGQPNLSNTFLWVALLAVAYDFFNESNRKIARFSLISVILWASVLTASRMLYLYFLLLVFYYLFLSFYKLADRGYRNSVLVIVAQVLVFIIFVPKLSAILDTELARAGVVDRTAQVNVMTRGFHDSARISELKKDFHALRQMTPTQLLVGIGPDNYAAFSEEKDLGLPSSRQFEFLWTNSHNIFTMFLVQGGFLGFVTILACFLYVGICIFKHAKKKEYSWLIGGVLVLALHSMVEYPLWYPWFLGLLAVLLIPICGVSEIQGGKESSKRIVAVFVFVFLLLFLFDVGGQARLIAKVAYSKKQDRHDYIALSLMGSHALLGPYATLVKYRMFSPEKGNLNGQLRQVDKMMSWRPFDLVFMRKFTIEAMMGDVSAACVTATELSKLYTFAAPLIMTKATMIHGLDANNIGAIYSCVSKGLAERNISFLDAEKIDKKMIDGLHM